MLFTCASFGLRGRRFLVRTVILKPDLSNTVTVTLTDFRVSKQLQNRNYHFKETEDENLNTQKCGCMTYL